MAVHLWQYGPDVPGEQHAAAPWFNPATVADDELLDVYTRDGHLAGGFTRAQVASGDWQVRCAVALSALKTYDGGGTHMDEWTARKRWVPMIETRMRRIGGPETPAVTPFDTANFRFVSEERYDYELMAWGAGVAHTTGFNAQGSQW